MATNLRDSDILQDFTVWIEEAGKIGECPNFQLPEINLAMEEFRGGGMDGTVEIPFGLEKIEYQFDLHTWDKDIWDQFGFGPGAQNVPVTFRGYTLTQNAAERGVLVHMVGTLKSIKPDAVEAGKKFKQTVHISAHQYIHVIDGQEKMNIDVYAKRFIVNGTDRSARARQFLSIP
jgi:uncharacterized protein